MTRLVLVIGLVGLATACGGRDEASPAPAAAPAAPSAPGAVTRTTQSGKYRIEVSFEPASPQLGQLFTVHAVVHEKDGRPLEQGQVTLDARMPQHGHGMETQPVQDPGVCEGDVCTHPGGRYTAQGFKFHMPGAWTVTIDVLGPAGPDSTSFVHEMR